MIRTVTLNPALDKTVEVDNFMVGAVNRVSSIRVDAGGKGINVSKIIKVLGGSSTAYGILAGNNGRYIKSCLDESGIDNDFIFVEGETRVDTKVVDGLNKTNTDINEPGPKVSRENLVLVESRLLSGISTGDILVFAGSVPPNVPADIYKQWIIKAKAAGAKTVLDCDGELLRQGMEAVPFMIKPNIHELERLLGRKFENIDEIICGVRPFIELGVEYAVISMGDKGALFISKDKIIHAEALNVIVKSTVGAGDAMVAAFVYGLENGYTLERCAALSVSCATAKVSMPGTQPPHMEDILKFQWSIQLNHMF